MLGCLNNLHNSQNSSSSYVQKWQILSKTSFFSMRELHWKCQPCHERKIYNFLILRWGMIKQSILRLWWICQVGHTDHIKFNNGQRLEHCLWKESECITRFVLVKWHYKCHCPFCNSAHYESLIRVTITWIILGNTFWIHMIANSDIWIHCKIIKRVIEKNVSLFI